MNHQSIVAVAAQGMDFERNRLELATLKISLANTTFSSLLEAETFVNGLHADKNKLLANDPDSLQIKSLADKTNPKADASGYVYKFDIDPTHEMATLVSATRAYEANVRAYNMNSQMTKAALDIGSK